MPYAPRGLIALLVACGALQVSFNLHDGVTPTALPIALAGSLAMLGTLFLLLRAGNKRERFVQTATAMAAVYLVFGIATNGLGLLLPIKKLREHFLAHPEQPPMLSGGEILVFLAIFVLGVWQLCVWIRILRRALETSLPGSILMLLVLVLVGWSVAGIGLAALGAT